MKDYKHYIALISILSFGAGLYLIFNYNRLVQIILVIGLGTAYVAWGVIHHHLKKDLYWHIVFEYLAVALLACLAVIFILLRA